VKISQSYSGFSCSKIRTFCFPVRCITAISFDEWEYWWVIRLKNTAADAAGGSFGERSEQLFLMIDNEAWYSLPIQCLIIGRDEFDSLSFLELKFLEEVKTYSYCSPSSLVLNLISVERRDSPLLSLF
jgi:hypothetical protein